MSDRSITTAASAPTSMIPGREPGEDVVNYLWRMAQDLPAPEGDLSDLIAERILAAGSDAEENEIWEATSSQKLVGRAFLWGELSWSPRPSKEGLPFFLVCRATDIATGEQTVVTTGAKNLVATLLAHHFRGQLPAAGEIVGVPLRDDPDRVALHIRWLGRQVNPDVG